MVQIVKHPVLDDALAVVRNKKTTTVEFRAALQRASVVLATHALQQLGTSQVSIETPMCTTECFRVDEGRIVLVPILRAGLALLDSFTTLLPSATVSHLGLYRDHATLESVEYYEKLPKSLAGNKVFILDPMLATGNSATAAFEKIAKSGATDITLVSLLAAPEGLAQLAEKAGSMHVVIGALDERLNEKGYIVPGLGDAGDRFFGTI